MSEGTNYHDVVIEAMRLADQIASKCNPKEKPDQKKHLENMSEIFKSLIEDAHEALINY